MPRTSKQAGPSDREERLQGLSDGERPISDVMTREVDVVAPDASVIETAGKMKARDVGAIAYGFEDQSVEKIGKLMEQRQIRRLPIVSRDHRLVGVVSLGDLAVKDQGHAAGDALAGILQPERSGTNT